MTNDKYPFCMRAGLSVIERAYYHQSRYDYIHAREVEAFLEKAPIIRKNDVLPNWRINKITGDTHTARIILIEPIANDTTDSLLRELVKGYTDCGTNRDAADFMREIVERARKILWEDR